MSGELKKLMFHQPQSQKIIPFHFTNRPSSAEVRRGTAKVAPDASPSTSRGAVQRQSTLASVKKVFADMEQPSSSGEVKQRRFLTIAEDPPTVMPASPNESGCADYTDVLSLSTPPRSPRGGRRRTIDAFAQLQEQLKRRMSHVGGYGAIGLLSVH